MCFKLVVMPGVFLLRLRSNKKTPENIHKNRRETMLGAIAGDVIGSIYEFHRPRIKSQDFPLFSPGSEFTDASVLTVAVADALLHAKDYARTIKEYALRYPHAGYGG